MGGDIWLDETYHSGTEGCPGARFIVNLNMVPLEPLDVSSNHFLRLSGNSKKEGSEVAPPSLELGSISDSEKKSSTAPSEFSSSDHARNDKK